MKVKCLNCGLVLEKCLSLDCICPKCDSSHWSVIIEGSEEKIDKESLGMIEDLVRMRDIAKEWLRKKDYIVFKKMGVPDEPIEHGGKEGLAFEIFEYFNGKKVQVRKIYLNGHIEGFEGDSCVINHAYPKLMRLKSVIVDMLRQMNKDYGDLIERHSLAGLPIDPVEFSKLHQAQLERIMNIKI